MVTGHQTPAWEAGNWKGQVRSCEHTQNLFMRKLEGEIIPRDPQDRCTYTSVRLSDTKFEITAQCPIREGPLEGTVGTIKTWVTLQGDREFHLRSEKTWPKAGAGLAVHFQLEEHGLWLKACKPQQ